MLHGDHDGSVKFPQDTYNPRVIMGPEDWELANARKSWLAIGDGRP